ncbi:SGNH/GDSL hydrolase family protein [Nocardioides speluncae]|uniref:SGNH/GDSL hydrolase family protein n=1 Tax=Nocardioides speluncae TaxID=2670337 RepID=UPI000D6A02DD|nr:SGNH/GDSL hydrolase family protein [Nocardioides speluncae]
MKLRTLVAAVTAVVGGLAGGLAAPAQASDDTIDYVALGDSYAAGSGVLPLAWGAPLLCAQSSRNLSHVLADSLDADLTDVTCGGAQTSHFYAKQYWNTPPQLDALSDDTDLVTLMIGGNDTNLFAGAIQNCVIEAIGSFGQGNPCERKYSAQWNQQIDGTIGPAVKKALADIVAKAPNAEVLIVGYPWIMPASGGCFAKMPIATGDVPFMRALQANLNDAIGKSAADNGVTFVDLAELSELSDGHDSCKPIGTRWVEPALFGLNFVPVHPNALGERKMAEAVQAALN